MFLICLLLFVKFAILWYFSLAIHISLFLCAKKFNFKSFMTYVNFLFLLICHITFLLNSIGCLNPMIRYDWLAEVSTLTWMVIALLWTNQIAGNTIDFKMNIINSYINTCGSWENSKLYENNPHFGRRVSIQFLVSPIPLVLISRGYYTAARR
jgi:hypothetical protein